MPDDETSALVARFRSDERPLTEPRVLRATREALVVTVRDVGGDVVLKQFRRPGRYAGEVRAHRRWVPAIADRAPELLAADDDSRSVMLTELPGAAPDSLTPGLLEQAGRLLRDFHHAAPAVVRRRAAQVEGRVARQLAACARLGLPLDRSWLQGQVSRARGLGRLTVVPCHGDYVPRNWLVDHRDALRAIDFEESHLDSPGTDIARLRFRATWGDPSAMESFMRGYGRALTEEEAVCADIESSLHAVGILIRATSHAHPALQAHAREVVDTLRRRSA